VRDGIRVCFVVAVADNGVIGNAGHLPWRMPTDLKRFRALTLGKPVIMGRKTFESIGKALDRRDNIVLTRSAEFSADGVEAAATIEAALALAHTHAARRGTGEIMVIGGAEVFRAAMPHADRIYLTRVHASPPGDVAWQAPDPHHWSESAREVLPQAANDQFPADFIVLDRRR
jgi:dihydrofolate reductase